MIEEVLMGKRCFYKESSRTCGICIGGVIVASNKGKKYHRCTRSCI
jgi:hypothetical protein